MSSSILLKVKLRSKSSPEVEHACKKVIIPNRHHIRSLNLENDLLIDDVFMFCIIDSSFHRFESIILHDISSNAVMKLFFQLRSLPRLYSLTINLNAEKSHSPADIYQSIFSLPHLKYNQLRTFSYERLNLFPPPVNNGQFSTIEHMVINHNCTFNELTSMLSHTPRLRHMICRSLEESNDSFEIEQPLVLSDLTYFHMYSCYVNYNVFEMFITKLSSPLQVLSIDRSKVTGYLEVDRWEKLINEHLPLLQRFNLSCLKKFDHYYQGIRPHMKLNWFTSQFWTKRQWLSKFLIYNGGFGCSVHSHR